MVVVVVVVMVVVVVAVAVVVIHVNAIIEISGRANGGQCDIVVCMVLT